jgi:hypothetical protein
MVISYTSSGDVSVKTKTETVTLGNDVTIGSFVVPGPGEYDIASIQCEAKPLATSFASFIRTEDLTVTFLSRIESEIMKMDDANATHILVVDVRSDVVLCGAGATKEFVVDLGIPMTEEKTLKLTRAGLPLEGTYLLNRD